MVGDADGFRVALVVATVTGCRAEELGFVEVCGGVDVEDVLWVSLVVAMLGAEMFGELGDWLLDVFLGCFLGRFLAGSEARVVEFFDDFCFLVT